jgi:hypothetical protein
MRSDGPIRRLTGIFLLAMLLASAPPGQAADGEVTLRLNGTNPLIQIRGDKDDDWRLQASTNLTTWTTLTNFGTLLSGGNNAPTRALGAPLAPQTYYRALKTAGLYDPSLFRTLSLTFTQANWGTALANARLGDSNIYCSMVTLDNGATHTAVGARYKGNSSYTLAGTKKSINLEFDWIQTNADLMTYQTVNLNNAAGDETIMREPLFFTIMSQYTPCPKGAMANVFINGSQWGVYSLVQQEDGDLIREWFPNYQGDRWRTPNAAPGGGVPGGGGAFTGSNSAFVVFAGQSAWYYTNHYILKHTATNTLTALQRLTNAIYVLNLTPTNQLRDRVEDVFAVDDWLWFLAIENLFVDDDSYWYKGADYGFYYEPNSGRIHPVEHDGNESFTATMSINYNLSPVTGATGNNRPLLFRLLPINELRQRYLAHMRTVLDEYFNPATATPMIDAFHRLSIAAILTDPNRGFTMAAYTNDLVALKRYVTNRYNFLKAHAELTPLQPNIEWVSGPVAPVYPTNAATLTARVVSNGSSGVGSVWLYFRDKAHGRFAVNPMFDDGAHEDGAANDGVFGASTTNYPAGHKIHYYIEARATNAARAARFAPARAEWKTYSYRVGLATAPATPVVINEFMADNVATLADPQGEFDDWIELRNLTDTEVDLTGRYLSDDPTHPRKWPFPAGTKIPADGYLMVWADEDGKATPGLHANFKLSRLGEEILLTDTDANFNAVLDRILFGPQETDRSIGRSAADADTWLLMSPTPGLPNE